jgi:hypothetical protein
MDRETIIKYGTGEARAIVAEAWFTFLGFVAATAVLHAAAEKTEVLPLTILKWTSYAMLFGWVNYKIDQLIWAHFPVADPTKKKAKNWHIALSVWVSSMIMFGVYALVFYLVNVLLKANAV